MATRLRLLVVALWLLAVTQMGEAGFATVVDPLTRTPWVTPPIPQTGTYMVSLRAGRGTPPLFVTLSRGSLAGNNPLVARQKVCLFRVMSHSRITHAEVAVALHEGDTLTVSMSSPSSDLPKAAFFSYAYVSPSIHGHFVTARHNNAATGISRLLFLKQLHTLRGWRPIWKYTFDVTTSGVYWVTVRTDPASGVGTLYLEAKCNGGSNILCIAYGEKLTPVSCSAAYYLAEGCTIQVDLNPSDTSGWASILSFVYLEGNRKPNTSPYNNIAFTGCFNHHRTHFNRGNEIPFENVLQDSGQLRKGTAFHISRSGSYMVSLTPDPYIINTAELILYLVVNRQGPTFYAYAQDGVMTGQTIALHLVSGDTVSVRCQGGVYERGSMFSIAFLQP